MSLKASGKQVVKILCCLLAISTSACSQWQLHAKAAEPTENIEKHGQWQLICEASEQNLEANTQKSRWFLAETKQGQPIYLNGVYQQGFLHLAHNKNPNIEALQSYCKNAVVKQSNPKKHVKWLHLQAARSKENIAVPLLLPKNESPSLKVLVFGDSLSDTGRLKQRMKIFPGQPYWLGRFSNGPAWPDYLQHGAKLALQNHAYGGAFTIAHEPVPEESILDRIRAGAQLFISGSVQIQIDDYIQQNLQGQPIQDPQNTVVILWAGANDYIFKEPLTGVIDTFLNAPETASGYKSIVNNTVEGLEIAIGKLQQAGVTNFILPSLPDIGKSPIALQNSTYMSLKKNQENEQDKVLLSKRLSQLSHYHNQKLAALVKQLSQRYPAITLLMADSNYAIAQIQQAKALAAGDKKELFDYGFDFAAHQETLQDGDKKITLQQRCYQGGYLGSAKAKDICQQPEQAFFWDVAHPTTYTHCWQAYYLMVVMHQQGWLAELPTLTNHKKWCHQVYQNSQVNKQSYQIF